MIVPRFVVQPNERSAYELTIVLRPSVALHPLGKAFHDMIVGSNGILRLLQDANELVMALALVNLSRARRWICFPKGLEQFLCIFRRQRCLGRFRLGLHQLSNHPSHHATSMSISTIVIDNLTFPTDPPQHPLLRHRIDLCECQAILRKFLRESTVKRIARRIERLLSHPIERDVFREDSLAVAKRLDSSAERLEDVVARDLRTIVKVVCNLSEIHFKDSRLRALRQQIDVQEPQPQRQLGELFMLEQHVIYEHTAFLR